MKRDALLDCLDTARECYRNAWARTSVDIAIQVRLVPDTCVTLSAGSVLFSVQVPQACLAWRGDRTTEADEISCRNRAMHQRGSLCKRRTALATHRVHLHSRPGEVLQYMLSPPWLSTNLHGAAGMLWRSTVSDTGDEGLLMTAGSAKEP